jgi:hypothetical protein
VSWRVSQVKEYYEVINIVYIHELQVYGTIENMGAFASVVKYTKDGVETEELIENDEFAIVDEIVFHHVEEEQE